MHSILVAVILLFLVKSKPVIDKKTHFGVFNQPFLTSHLSPRCLRIQRRYLPSKAMISPHNYNMHALPTVYRRQAVIQATIRFLKNISQMPCFSPAEIHILAIKHFSSVKPSRHDSSNQKQALRQGDRSSSDPWTLLLIKNHSHTKLLPTYP